MKKSTILFSLFATGILSGSVFATAPSAFSDVPQHHWAYAAVQKLVDEGLVEGYTDKNFQDDRPISRYEFAIITVRAQQKIDSVSITDKQTINKLSNEFSNELNLVDARDARIKKIESKTKIYVGGETRFRYFGDDVHTQGVSGGKSVKGSDHFDFRQRIYVKGDIDNQFSFLGRVTASGKLGDADKGNSGNTVTLDLFNVMGKKLWGFDSIVLGRMGYNYFGNGLIGKPAQADGIGLTKTVGKLQFKGWTGDILTDSDLGTGSGDSGNANQLTSAQMTYTVNKNLALTGGYYWADINGTAQGNGMGSVNILGPSTSQTVFSGSNGWLASATASIGKYTLLVDYISTHLDDAIGISNTPKAWAVQFGKMSGKVKKFYNASDLVDHEQAGSSGWAIGYHVSDPGATPNNMGGFDTVTVAYANQPYSTFSHATDNTRAWYFAYQYVPRKNILLSLDYAKFWINKRQYTNLTDDALDDCWSARLQFFF